MLSRSQVAARLDRLPVTRLHKAVLVSVAFAFLFEFGDLNTFAYVAPALKEQLGFHLPDIALVTSAAFLGMFFGGVLGGRFSDAVGRRKALIAATILFSSFSLINALGFNVGSFLVFRFFTGVGLSAMTVAATTYVSEVMPAARRGRMQAAVMAIGLAGIPIISFSARAIIPIAPGTWRLVFVVGALALLAVPALLLLPESPRWLLQKGRIDAAEATLARFERSTTTLPALDLAAFPDEEKERKLRYRELFRGVTGRRTAFLAVVWIFQTLGFYGFIAWVPTLLAAHGFSLATSLQFSALTTIGAVPGALLAWPLSDRFGRKLPLVIVAIATAGSGLAYGLTFNPVAIVVFGFCVNLLIQTFATLLYTYSPELFPTGLRNSGHGLVYGVGRLANIFGPLIVASLFSTLGYQAVFAYIAGCWAVVALSIWIFGPRTGKIALEALNEERRPASGPRGHLSDSNPVTNKKAPASS